MDNTPREQDPIAQTPLVVPVQRPSRRSLRVHSIEGPVDAYLTEEELISELRLSSQEQDTLLLQDFQARRLRRKVWFGVGLIGVLFGIVAIMLLFNSANSSRAITESYMKSLSVGRADEARLYFAKDIENAELLRSSAWSGGPAYLSGFKVGDAKTIIAPGQVRMKEVRVYYSIGAVSHQGTVTLKRVWGLDNILEKWAIVKPLASTLSLTLPSGYPGQVIINGITLPRAESGTVAYWVYPGTYNVGLQANTWISADAITEHVEAGRDQQVQFDSIQPSDSLQGMLQRKVAIALNECLRSTLAAPPGCPFSIDAPQPVTWTSGSDVTLDVAPHYSDPKALFSFSTSGTSVNVEDAEGNRTVVPYTIKGSILWSDWSADPQIDIAQN
ncbi:MAG: hypothetical protein Q4G30_10065 [Actinomycetaceae bacterium]|nr:hypothetical protein [Actinomycetaceae bacterium]